MIISTYASGCTGIMGLDLAVEKVTGACPIWCAEPDPNCAATIAKHKPDLYNYGYLYNVVEIHEQVPTPDLFCAGFPCQDASQAGLRRGMAGARTGPVWRQVVDTLRHLRPRFVFLENVAGLLAPGRGFDEVLGDLAALGFDAEWSTLRAADVGAPHGRRRIFILGHDAARAPLSDAERDELRQLGQRFGQQHPLDVADASGKRSHGRRPGDGRQARHELEGGHQAVADAREDRRQGLRSSDDDHGRHAPGHLAHRCHAWPPAPGDADGWGRYEGSRPGVRRSAYGPSRGLHARQRRARVAMLGNAVVPQQAAYALAGLAIRLAEP